MEEQKVLRKSAERMQAVLAEFGFELEVKELAASTRTAAEAAEAIGCSVAQIAKSLIFKGQETGQPILIIASGVNRVNEKTAAMAVGEKFERATPDFVFENTGYKIGGVPPVGHKNTPLTLIDEDIFQYDEIWAAAGTPHAVFRLTPKILADMTQGKVISVK